MLKNKREFVYSIKFTATIKSLTKEAFKGIRDCRSFSRHRHTQIQTEMMEIVLGLYVRIYRYVF